MGVYNTLFIWLLLSQITGNTLPYDELHHIQARLEELAPHLVRYGDMEPANFFGLAHKLVKVIISLEVIHNFLLVPVVVSLIECVYYKNSFNQTTHDVIACL